MRKRYLFLLTATIFLASACNTVSKKNLPSKQLSTMDSIPVKLQIVAGMPEMPIELNVANDNSGRTFITDVKGKIWILKSDSVLSKPFFNLYEKIGKQDSTALAGMIFSVAFHPQFASNHKFYVSYNAPSKPKSADSKLVVAEFVTEKNNPNIADINSGHIIMEFKGATVQQNGAHIAFGPDGYLYISLGDDNANDTTYHYHAQDLQYYNGKLLRIDVNKTPYAIPPDNPFINVKNAKPEIWAYGFRKLWHFSFDPHTGLLFGGDVGQDREEEIDIVSKGSNYGWPVMEGDSVYLNNFKTKDSTYVAPINTYDHKTGICVIGGNFYYGNEIPALKNKYVFADWNNKLFALSKDSYGKWHRQAVKIVNPPDGSLYICGCGQDAKNQFYVMGYLVKNNNEKGVIYKLKKD